MIVSVNISKERSSLIKRLEYDFDSRHLHIEFHTWLDPVDYFCPNELFEQLVDSDSYGKFYLDQLKPFLTKIKTNNMGKKPDKIVDIRVNLSRLNKDWFNRFTSKDDAQEVSVDLTILLYDEPNKKEYNGKVYYDNGFVTQKVPKEVWEKDKDIKGAIVGNAKDWSSINRAKEGDISTMPGAEGGVMAGSDAGAQQDWQDDLPF
jgi:hypothetical protein